MYKMEILTNVDKKCLILKLKFSNSYTYTHTCITYQY